MPNRSNKSGKSAPSKQRKAKLVSRPALAAFAAEPPAPEFGVEPPIIIQGGGSVTVLSQYQFTETHRPGDPYPYVYYSADASIARMKMRGKGGEKGDDSDHGKFKIELYK
jgi:hypothetical protein